MRSPRALETHIDDTRGERTRLLVMSAYLLLIITCYTTTKAVRDSLFVIEVGPAQLPLLYMLTAVSMAIISAIYPTALRRIGLFSLVRVTSLVSVGSMVAFWEFISYGGRLSLYLLYIWVSLFGAITASQAWSLANHVFDAREARKSFAWIGLGGVVGGIVGGSLARVVSLWMGTETLLPICAALMGVTILLLHPLGRGSRQKDPVQEAEPKESEDSGLTVFAKIRESRYLSMMVFLLLSGVIVEAFLDYEYKVLARQAFDSKDHLTSFFGTIASYGGMLALVIQLLLTGPLLRRFGVGAAIVIFPATLLGAFLLVAARPTLWAVSVLKLADSCLSYSVHRSGMELLYVPIPTKLRASVKALIDLLVDRAGRAAGGLLLLILTTALSLSLPSLSLVAAGALVVWIVIALSIRREYVQAFRSALEKKVIEPESLNAGSLDSSATNALLQALFSNDERQVLYALDMLGNGPTSRWSRYLPGLLEHESPAVRSRALALLTEANVFSPESAEPRLVDPDLNVRVEAVRHLSVSRPGVADRRLKEFLGHENFEIVLAAIHCIAQYRPNDSDLIDEALIERALTTPGDNSSSAKTAAARALAITRLPRTNQFLDQLLHDPSVEVVQQAIRTCGEITYEAAIPSLIPMLAQAPLRREAREALLRMGDAALNELQNRFRDPEVPMEVRVRIPKVLSFSGKQVIADFLLGEFQNANPRLAMPILRALNRMRSQSTALEFNVDHISELIRAEREKHQRLEEIRQGIRGGGSDRPDNATGVAVHEGADPASTEILDLLDTALGERLEENVERVFRLLYLIYPPADIHSAYFSFSSRPGLRASAVEFLDNLIDPALRPLVLPLVEQPETEPKKAGMSQAEALQTLLTEGDALLQSITAELASRWRIEGVPSGLRIA